MTIVRIPSKYTPVNEVLPQPWEHGQVIYFEDTGHYYIWRTNRPGQQYLFEMPDAVAIQGATKFGFTWHPITPEEVAERDVS